MRQDTYPQARLLRDNRQLRAALTQLLDELESSGVAKGHGDDPDSGPNCDCVREAIPDLPGHGDRAGEAIQPPWEREGYETKNAWLSEKREA